MERTFGPYRLLRRIASGGMGEVWLAVLEREGGFAKTVALKTILPQLAARADFAARFEHEAACAALLSHPNIVQVFDYGRIEQRSYLTMEYVAGSDLASCLAAAGQRSWPPALASELGVQLCRGLGHAHGCRDSSGRPAGLVHGDVSPSNVLLSRDGVAKLADFGLARLRSSGDPGELAGKPAYLSPEQAAGAAARPASDLYALALILVELLCGRRARADTGALDEALASARSGRLRDWRAEASVPSELADAVDAALAVAPADRPGSAAALGEALARACPPAGPEALAAHTAELAPQEASVGLRPDPTEVAARPVVGKRGSDRRWLGGLLGLLGLGWALGFGWWWLHPAPPDRPAPPASDRSRPPAAPDPAPAAATADQDPTAGDATGAAEQDPAAGHTAGAAEPEPAAEDAAGAAEPNSAVGEATGFVEPNPAAGNASGAVTDPDPAAGDTSGAVEPDPAAAGGAGDDAEPDAVATGGTEAAATDSGPRDPAPALLAAAGGTEAASRPAPGAAAATERGARPAAAPLELRLSADLRAELDHRPVAGRRLRLDRDRAHLVRLAPAAGGEPAVLLRLTPAGRAGDGWELAVRARPWMRIRLAGRPAGQTPRRGLRIGPGRTVLELDRGPQRLRLELVAAEQREEP